MPFIFETYEQIQESGLIGGNFYGVFFGFRR